MPIGSGLQLLATGVEGQTVGAQTGCEQAAASRARDSRVRSCARGERRGRTGRARAGAADPLAGTFRRHAIWTFRFGLFIRRFQAERVCGVAVRRTGWTGKQKRLREIEESLDTDLHGLGDLLAEERNCGLRQIGLVRVDREGHGGKRGFVSCKGAENTFEEFSHRGHRGHRERV